jgi:M6 family metalloprotease-like protein
MQLQRLTILNSLMIPTWGSRLDGSMSFRESMAFARLEDKEEWEVGRIAIGVHEAGHILGLPDLYGKPRIENGIGNFGLMGKLCWVFYEGR